nr:MAG TPA: hypothetical protein [Caudoviricetes sp.]
MSDYSHKNSAPNSHLSPFSALTFNLISNQSFNPY